MRSGSVIPNAPLNRPGSWIVARWLVDCEEHEPELRWPRLGEYLKARGVDEVSDTPVMSDGGTAFCLV